MGRPTMNDVARHAGVSLKTVSRVVNGETSVSADLAARVQAAVDMLHYRPNIGASMLRRADRRTRTIAVLLEDVGNPFSSSLHRAVEDEARTRGVQVLTGSLDEDPQRERELARVFTMRRADGLIIAPASTDQAYLATEVQQDTPVVFVDRPANGFPGDCVIATNVTGATEAVRHLVAHGHRRIAHLGDYARIPTARSRHQGYLAALAEAGLAVEPDLIVQDLHDEAAAESATMTLYARPDPPTALFTSQNLVTVGAVRALRRLRLHRAVAVVGFDDFPLADLLEPAVTVVAQDPALMGRTAARALFERIDGATGAPREFWIPTSLIRRGSGELPPSRSLRDAIAL
ncbi:LacI family DNA-binding transcriptional regulator [Spirilliplanes yamanashiensis]|uniref:LacI family transcriptional regulator n=1 Tax=Spirilliplanes yamanashiensis TaxID=42233 RepID=A0A8J3Y8M3_9ACTN|nr:LacI family DNA-binding transcriptional regulator [Spirilliplanes yamanashiensis]MDP9815679.1 LacI family transcriptional regulator [Spirilliplanes yamanashiensis]GIJ03933.1 LacI family transcriptional regulator [Spirilliplanes yamanashiensis]